MPREQTPTRDITAWCKSGLNGSHHSRKAACRSQLSSAHLLWQTAERILHYAARGRDAAKALPGCSQPRSDQLKKGGCCDHVSPVAVMAARRSCAGEPCLEALPCCCHPAGPFSQHSAEAKSHCSIRTGAYQAGAGLLPGRYGWKAPPTASQASMCSARAGASALGWQASSSAAAKVRDATSGCLKPGAVLAARDPSALSYTRRAACRALCRHCICARAQQTAGGSKLTLTLPACCSKPAYAAQRGRLSCLAARRPLAACRALSRHSAGLGTASHAP